MRVVFVSCFRFSYHIPQHLPTLLELELAGIITRQQTPFDTDFQNLAPLAGSGGTPDFITKDNKQNTLAAWTKKLQTNVFINITSCLEWKFQRFKIYEEINGKFPLPCNGETIHALPTVKESSSRFSSAESLILSKEIN